MTVNNYDMSSTGLNLELSAFHNIDVAQMDFDQSFHVLQYAGICTPSILVFSQFGNVNVDGWDPCDYENWDFSTTTVKEMISVFIKDQFYGNPDYSNVKDILIDLDNYDVLPLRNATKEDAFNSIKEYIDDDADFLEYLEKVAYPTFAETKSRGYCQGDVSYVYIPKTVIDLHDGHTVDTIGDHLHGLIGNLLWDAPVYAKVEIRDGDQDIDLVECLKDSYQWDRDEVLNSESLKDQIANYDDEQQKIIMDFLSENLPENLEYV